MSATVINQVLAQESGRIAPDILQKTMHISPYLDLIPQGSWSEEMGNAINVLTFGRSLPASTYSDGGNITNLAYDSSFWTNIGSGNFGTSVENNCTPPTIVVQQGNDVVPFSLQHAALESQRFCVTDLMNSFQRNRQLTAVRKNLTDITAHTLAEKFRREYVYWCDNKVVVTASGVTESTSSGAVSGAATFNTGTSIQTAGSSGQGILTNALLERWHQRLVRRGAGANALEKMDGAPVFGLVCSAETSLLLKLESGIRDDIRWNANRVNELLAPLGCTSAPIRGFQHIVDPTPPRWNWTGAAWAKVEPYIVKAATVGYKIEENPAYELAGWEDSIVLHQDLLEIVFPGSTSNGEGTGFTPVSYRGDWQWKNILNETTNPDGQIGYWRGVFILGGMPKFTNYGVIFRHARCAHNPIYAACS